MKIINQSFLLLMNLQTLFEYLPQIVEAGPDKPINCKDRAKSKYAQANKNSPDQTHHKVKFYNLA